MYTLALLYLFIGVTFASPKMQLTAGCSKPATFINELSENIHRFDSKTLITTVNELTDMILKEVRNYMVSHGLDPVKLPDIHKNYSNNDIIITYKEEIDLTEGVLQNSSSLYRAGDVIADYSHRKLSLDIPLNFKTFTFHYHYRAKLMGLGSKGIVEGKVEYTKLFSSIELDFSKKFVTLKNFKIEKIGDIKIKFYGNTIKDEVMDILSDAVTMIFKRKIEHISERKVKSALQKIIDCVNKILKNL